MKLKKKKNNNNYINNIIEYTLYKYDLFLYLIIKEILLLLKIYIR